MQAAQPSSPPSQTTATTRISRPQAALAIALLLLIITLWNRARGVQGAASGLYYLPIGLAAVFFAWPGALLTAALASLGTMATAASGALWASGALSSWPGAWSARPDAGLDIPLFFGFALLLARLLHGGRTVDQLAFADPMSGLPNRHHLLERLGEETRRARAAAQPLAVLLLDADNLRALNERFGQARGDDALRDVAAIVRRSIRAMDVPGRVTDAKFAIVLPETPPQGARLVAERIRKAVESRGAQSGVPLTVSLGVVDVDPAASHDPAHLLAQADEALFEAKRTGRNRIVTFDPEMQGAR